MPRFGFIGPTYSAQSPSISAELCRNWFTQVIESGGGKSQMVFLPSPGLKSFCALPDPSVRQLFYFNGRCFAVGQRLYELFSNGTFTAYGAVATDGNPAFIAANQIQLLICSGGSLYVFTLATNTLSAALNDPTGVLQVGYGDGYFVALLANSNVIRVSNPLDGTTWPGAQKIAVSYFPDNVTGMIFEHRELILFGQKQTVFYGDTGSLNIFDPVPSGFIEQGCAAAFSPVRIDNTAFWIGQDERGAGIGWKTNGYTPVRVTNHAIESRWQSYSTIADARSYSYQMEGHSFWHVYFPTANASWRYDVATGMWHEVDYWDATQAASNAHHSQCHAYAFGQHLVGDWSSGNIYQLDTATYTDNGNLIRRVRRAPYIASEEEWIYHYRLQLLFEAGLALQSGQGSAPVINLRWSDDAGHTWSNEHSVSAGLVGQYRARAIWRRLGRSRGRVYEVSVSDPIAWRLIDAYLEDSSGPEPVQRLSDRFRESA